MLSVRDVCGSSGRYSVRDWMAEVDEVKGERGEKRGEGGKQRRPPSPPDVAPSSPNLSPAPTSNTRTGQTTTPARKDVSTTRPGRVSPSDSRTTKLKLEPLRPVARSSTALRVRRTQAKPDQLRPAPSVARPTVIFTLPLYLLTARHHPATAGEALIMSIQCASRVQGVRHHNQQSFW